MVLLVAQHYSLLAISLDRHYAISNSLRYPYVFTHTLGNSLIAGRDAGGGGGEWGVGGGEVMCRGGRGERLGWEGIDTHTEPHTERRFPAPSSKLCQI